MILPLTDSFVARTLVTVNTRPAVRAPAMGLDGERSLGRTSFKTSVSSDDLEPQKDMPLYECLKAVLIGRGMF